jgi:hypothetical protein
MPVHTISKTSFLKFEQCPKAFYFYRNHPYLRDKAGIDKQLTFRRGHDVGYFARQLFPGGIDVYETAANSENAVAITAQLIKQKIAVIYEAAFLFDGVLILVDILCRDGEKYTAYEVKSSLKVSETYLKDACLQYYVLKNALEGFHNLFLVTLNPDYELQGTVDPRKLFRKRSVKERAEENTAYFQFQVSAANKVLEQNAIPNIPIGIQCFRPYQCDYFGTCWKETIHEKSIFNLPLANKLQLLEWHNMGLRNIEQVPDELIGKDALVKIKNAFVSGAPIVEHQKIESFLALIKMPVTAMDMEVWSPAIPQLQGVRPFEQIPFLVCFYDGKHYTDFFAENREDDREDFAGRLVALSGHYATILVYDKSMEVNVIDNLVRKYPQHAPALVNLKSKLVDVFDVFLHLHYYHPAFKNSFSLKTVSAALLNDITYTKITSGLEAMSYYEQYRLAENELERSLLRTELIEYCNTDSLATFKLVDFLRKLGPASESGRTL